MTLSSEKVPDSMASFVLTESIKTEERVMKGDVGKVDQVFRVFAGIFVLALGLVLGSWWGLMGLVLLGTGMAARCPLYAMLGFSSTHWDTSIT